MRNNSLSTGDLARFCQVTPATIVNWIRAGKLDVYTTPGGQYRMELDKFLQFLKENSFPIPDELQTQRARRILVMDDNPELLKSLTRVLKKSGLKSEIILASNGYDGLIQVGDFKPDVISLELAMPKLDGAEMIRRLRSNPDTKGIRILVLTGQHRNTDIVRRTRRIGVDVFMFKPVDMEDYLAAITELSFKSSF